MAPSPIGKARHQREYGIATVFVHGTRQEQLELLRPEACQMFRKNDNFSLYQALADDRYSLPSCSPNELTASLTRTFKAHTCM